MSRIIGYYLAPFSSFDVKNILIVFREEDMDGTLLAFNVLEGMCRFNQENLKEWHAMRLIDALDAFEGFVLPTGFLSGAGSLVRDAWEKCRGYNPKRNLYRYMQCLRELVREEEGDPERDGGEGKGRGGEQRRRGKAPRGRDAKRRRFKFSPERPKARAAMGRPRWKDKAMGRG